MLNQVDLPDGSQSTWTSTQEPSRGYVKIDIFEAAAAPGDRRKTVRYTLNSGFKADGTPASQVKGFVRQAENGEGETTHATRSQGSSLRYIYEGGNRIYRMEIASKGGPTSVRRVTDTAWHGGFHNTDASTWQVEEVTSRTYDNRPYVSDETDPLGRVQAIARVPISGAPTANTLADGTTNSATFNSFDRPLAQTDRLGRVRTSTYDPSGNLLARTEGSGTPEASTTTYLHNARGQVIEERDAEYDPATPDLYNTQYQYDADGYLIARVEAADVAGGTRPTTTFTYDAVGRLSATTDPANRTVTYTYDNRSRHIQTTYHDGSTEITTYGGGADSNLVLSRTDRNGIVTAYAYDQADRVTTTTRAQGTAEEVVETCTYLWGTKKKSSCTIRGERTDYEYDHDNRLVGTTVHADANTALTSSSEYDQLGRRRSETDSYGRTTYYLYDQNDRITRTVRETVPGGAGMTAAGAVPAIVPDSPQTARAHSYTITTTSGENLATSGTHTVTYTDPRDLHLANMARDAAPNAPYVVTDTIYDAEGQALIRIDAGGHETWTIYDALGRATRTFEAAATSVELLAETDYDRNSNVTERRHPRHFAENIPCIDTYTFNGRNLVASHTTAPGAAEEATESWTYNPDGTQSTHTDFRGNTTEYLWHACCGRAQATIDRDGESTSITNTDYAGRRTHTAVVSADPTANPGNDWHDPVDAETVRETTTRFDGFGRPTHTTRWLVPLGQVVDHARTNLGNGVIPIAGFDGVPATDGLTTTYQYDEDLTDGAGIDATYAAQFTELAARGVSFGADSDGYAVATTNPEGETSVRVSDGAGRTVMAINGEGEIATVRHDVVEGHALLPAWNGAIPLPGDYLKTTATDHLGNTRSQYSDALGRTVVTVDGLGHPSAAAYDPDGSILRSRDPNGLGQDCSYDELHRRTACADLQEQAESTQRTWTYNAASQVTAATDAAGNSDTAAYDARGRTLSTTDRNTLTTSYTYDPNSNLLTLTDPKGNTRSWEYDARDLTTAKNYPDHVSGIDRWEYGYDALARLANKKDNSDQECDYLYDLAGRLTTRDYTDAGGAAESSDTLSYDGASRLISGTKGRYAVTSAFAYDAAGRRTSETTTVFGRSYTAGQAYDGAGRPTTLTYPDGPTLTTGYDARHLPTGSSYEGSNLLTLTHDAGGRETQRAFANGLTQTITYGRQDDLRTADETTGNNIEGLRFAYTYDAVKRVLGEEALDTGPGLLDEAGFDATYDAGGRGRTRQDMGPGRQRPHRLPDLDL